MTKSAYTSPVGLVAKQVNRTHTKKQVNRTPAAVLPDEQDAQENDPTSVARKL